MNTLYVPNITGSWYGHNQQLLHGIPVKTRISCEIVQAENQITGQMVFSIDYISNPVYLTGEERRFETQFRGNWIQGKVLKLDWTYDEESLLIGSAYMELMHNGEKLAGKFVGFGPESFSFVSGDMMLRRS